MSLPMPAAQRPGQTLASADAASPLKLFDLVLELEPDLQPVAMGSTTFRAAIASLLDLLIDQPMPTLVWSKLPRGDSWQLELDRYRQQSVQAQAVCSFWMQQDLDNVLQARPAAESAQPLALTCPELGRVALQDDQGQDWLSDRAMAPLISVPLEPGGALGGEYFVLVTSPEFQGLILAERSQRLSVVDTLADGAGADGAGANGAGDGVGMDASLQSLVTSPPAVSPLVGSASPLSGQSSSLRMVVSCDPGVIAQVLSRLQQVITQVTTNDLRVSQTTASAAQASIQASAQATVSVKALLCHWSQLFVTSGATGPATGILNQWLMKQFQRQEGLWRRLSHHRKQAAHLEARQQQQQGMLEAVRLQDELLSVVMQELRTPLTNMKTALSLLNASSLKPAQRQRYLQLLNGECDRQESLISGLLTLSQIEQAGEVALQSLVLSELLPGVVSTYQPLAEEKGIVLRYHIPEGLPPITCRTPWLRQVITNLLHNSIRFTPSGGQVWVRAKRQGDYVQVDVQDTGVGIAASEIPKIFNRFYRVRVQGLEECSGAGLGLTIVQQLLLRCGGSITVNSRLNQGATFSVLLPIYRPTGDRASHGGDALEAEADEEMSPGLI